jgi:putative flavoprotein involved in K+ transport
MRKTDVVIIGGGQSGLVMSRCLSIRGIDHVVLERARIGERWKSERWNSLYLLTSKRHSALPGLTHQGRDPGAFMRASAFASYLDFYAAIHAAPVHQGVTVTGVSPSGFGFQVATDAGTVQTRAVVVATGAYDTPFRPAMAANLPGDILQLSPSAYRDPAQVPEGGVLVVGASSTGIQLAEEIQAAGRQVTLAVGEHTRSPRQYRGRDVYAWFDLAGILDDPALETGNLKAARRQPSLQLVGGPFPRDLNLGTLYAQGVRMVGRLSGLDGTAATFARDLQATTTASHDRMARTLNRVDAFIHSHAIIAPPADPEHLRPIILSNPQTTIDLKREGIRSIIWATGYTRRYPWLKLPVLDADGEISHRGGVASFPGIFALGLTFLRRRRSNFIDGCGMDAEDLAPEIARYLDHATARVA